MTEQIINIESKDDSLKDLSINTELEGEPIMTTPNDSMFIKVPNTNSVESNSACGKACGKSNGVNETVSVQPSYVWAFGKVCPIFPDICIQKEYEAACKNFAEEFAKSGEKSTKQPITMYDVLKKPENKYLVRKLCWSYKIAEVYTYFLLPADTQDYCQLVEAINPNINDQLSIVIGTNTNNFSDPFTCNCLQLPIVIFDQLHYFGIINFLNNVKENISENVKNKISMKMDEKVCDKPIDDLFNIVLWSNNLGGTDEDRAINYTMTKFDIYEKVVVEYSKGYCLDTITTRPVLSTGARKMVDVIFNFVNWTTGGIDQYFVRVDVTCEFPFIVHMPKPLMPIV